jgi:hypothetical protein
VRVVLSAGKRGHYYLAARALHGQGVLAHFVTSAFFPERSWRRRLVPAHRVEARSDGGLEGVPVTSLWPVELGYRVAHALRFGGPRLTRIYNTCFDRASARLLPADGDTFHVATTYALHSTGAAHAAGMRVVL